MNETIESYNKSAERYEDKFASYAPYNKSIAKFIKYLKTGSSVLDIGCGPGINSRMCIDNGLNVKGIDLSSKMIELAKVRCPEGTFVIQDVNDISGVEAYDSIIASFIIVHLRNDEMIRFIEKATRIIKVHGYLYISFMIGKLPGYESTSFCPDGSFYYNYYSKDMVKNTIENNNMRMVEEFVEDYKEKDGSITEDVFMIFKKY